LLFVLPACNQLLGISNPTAGDATAGDGPRPDGPMPEDAALDAPPACTTATSFGADVTSAIGGTGVALAIGRFDQGAVNDVAVAITTDTVILVGDNLGGFAVSQQLAQPAIAVVTDDFDLVGTRDDLVLVTPTSGVVRRQKETGGAGVFTDPVQPIDTFTNADLAFTAQFGLGFSDLVIHDDTGNIVYSSLGTDGTFAKTTTLGVGGERVVFAGNIDRANNDDVITVDATGTVRLALANGSDSFDPQTIIATGATGLGVGVGKFDGDTFLDLMVATADGGEVYLQNSASPGVFTKQTGTFGGIKSTVPLLVGDVNGDGLDDVLTPTTVTLQCPTTRVFTQVESINAANAVLGDVTGDSKLDLLRLSGTDLIVRVQ
jgi:hypothetical protein